VAYAAVVGFSTKMLQPDEELVMTLRPHWWALSKGIVALAVAVALGVFSLVVANGLLQLLAVVALVGALGIFGESYIRWARTQFVVTSERIIFQQGLVSRTGTQMPLEKVNTVDFHQSVFERVIRAGDLIIESGSERGTTTFSDIRNPMTVQEEINRQMDLHDKRGRQGMRPATVPEQISQLADLHARGLITAEEFETKKSDLLGRM
jgi:uncharacterized membrane protein YdbT with pleckstrin-like domain